MAGKHRVPMRSAKKYISKLKIIGAAPHVGLSPWAHHDFAQDPVIGTCYNIDPASKLEPISTKWQAHRCWHKICCAAQNH